MVYSELITYLREQTQQGVPADILRQTLMEAGWVELDIENALHDVAAGLAPLTEGVSLHEDVSQVRAMVAHLASRVRAIEARLTATGALPMQGELPGGTGAPERTLAPGRHSKKITGSIAVIAIYVAVVFIVRWAGHALSHTQQFIAAVAFGAMYLGIAIIAMRRRHPWVAAFSTTMAVAAWASTTYIAWHTYAVVEWTTVLAVGVLLLVLTVVMGRWIDRFAKA